MVIIIIHIHPTSRCTLALQLCLLTNVRLVTNRIPVGIETPLTMRYSTMEQVPHSAPENDRNERGILGRFLQVTAQQDQHTACAQPRTCRDNNNKLLNGLLSASHWEYLGKDEQARCSAFMVWCGCMVSRRFLVGTKQVRQYFIS